MDTRGLGHPAAPLAYRGRRAAHPGAPGSHGPAPLLGTGPAVARPWQRPASSISGAPLIPAPASCVGWARLRVQGCCPASSGRVRPKGAPGDGIFSAMHDGAGRSGPCSPRALPSIWTGSRALALWGHRCCWPSAGWPGEVPLPAPASTPAPPGAAGCPCPAPGCSSPVLASSAAATASS